jgi:hypothetical protein
MIRKMLQSALCLFLSPLLVAQQTAQPAQQTTEGPASSTAANASGTPSEFITLPKNAGIDVVSLDPVSSASTKAGSQIRLRVSHDVVVRNVTVIRAGTLLTGTVTKVIAGSRKNHRNGQIKIRIDRLELAHGQSVRFTGKTPQERLAQKEDRKDAAKIPFALPLIPIFLPWFVAMTIGMWGEGGKDSKPTGNDVGMPKCFSFTAYTTGRLKVHIADLYPADALPSDNNWGVCPSGYGVPTFQVSGFQVE